MHLLGTGEVIRGLIIDIADLGKGRGQTIVDAGKEEVKEARAQMRNRP
jgi:hypothetical protein